MTAPRWVYAAVVACLAGMLLAGFAAHERQIGARDAALKTLSTGYARLTKDYQRLQQEKAKVDTEYVAALGTLTRIRITNATTLDTLPGLTITKVQARKLLADEQAQCDATLAACARQVAIRDSMLFNRDTALANRNEAIRLLSAKHVTIKTHCIVGPQLATDGRVRVGVSCGIGF